MAITFPNEFENIEHVVIILLINCLLEDGGSLACSSLVIETSSIESNVTIIYCTTMDSDEK